MSLSASPAAAIRFLTATVQADVRSILPDIRVPTLVAHVERDLLVPVAQERYVADHVPDADFVVFDSDVHVICVSDVLDQLADHMRRFIERVALPSGARGTAAPEHREFAPTATALPPAG